MNAQAHNQEPGALVLTLCQGLLQRAKANPWLASALLRHIERLLGRFLHTYERLRALPRSSRRVLRKRLATTLAGAALLLSLGGLSAPPAYAADMTVTVATALTSGDGCSLAEAIINANDDAPTHTDCPAGSGADTITLGANGTFSYTAALGSGTALPGIASAITIEANGATIARDTGSLDDFGILEVSPSGDLTLNDATISGGRAQYGGGIYNNAGTLTINRCTISNNEATDYDGGGIYNFGTLTLNDSTVSGNTAYWTGGGIASIDPYTYSISTTLNNSTVTGNTAELGGGGIALYAYYGQVTTTLNRSLISGNSGPGPEIFAYNYDGAITNNANNFNLLGDSSKTNADAFYGFTPCSGGGCTDITAASDGSDPTALADILDPTLADNGGPTQTHALVSGSPAIDAAPSADCTAAPIDGLDQRGEARNVDLDGSDTANECDIGAVERQPCDFNVVAPNTWTQVGLSCAPDTPTVTGVFGDDFTPGGYDTTWVVYRYDPGTKVYEKLALGDTLNQDEGYWIYSTTEGTWDIDGTATALTSGTGCTSPTGCYEIPLTAPSGGDSYRHNMIDMPLDMSVAFADMRIVTAGDDVYTPAQAASNNLLYDLFYHYNGSGYDRGTSAGGDFNSHEGFWIYTRPGAAAVGVDPIWLLVPK